MSRLLPADVQRQLQSFESIIEAVASKVKLSIATFKAAKQHGKDEVDHLAAARQQQQLAELLTTVMRLYLVARGVDPEGHDMKRDEGRAKVYQRKVRLADPAAGRERSGATASLDVAAANRFITHAIPDLTPEQREQLKQATIALTGGKQQAKGQQQQGEGASGAAASAAADGAADDAAEGAAGSSRPSKRPKMSGKQQQGKDPSQQLVASILQEALAPVKDK